MIVDERPHSTLSTSRAAGSEPSVVPTGDFFEDLVVGTELSLGSHLFTRGEIVDFACNYDPQPFHLDDAAAADSALGGLAASGWHTAVVWMKLYVRHRSEVRDALLQHGGRPAAPGPSPGFSDMRWRCPVRPGDTISYRSTITGKRALGRKNWGLVLHHSTGTNQHGRLALDFDGSVFWQKRQDVAA